MLFTDGQRMQRKFEGAETIGRVYDWVDGEETIPHQHQPPNSNPISAFCTTQKTKSLGSEQVARFGDTQICP